MDRILAPRVPGRSRRRSGVMHAVTLESRRPGQHQPFPKAVSDASYTPACITATRSTASLQTTTGQFGPMRRQGIAVEREQGRARQRRHPQSADDAQFGHGDGPA